MYRSGLLYLANYLTSGKLNIMCYHGFVPKKNKPFCKNPLVNKFLPADVFEKHLELYLEYSTPISLETIISGVKLPPNALVITIDDGYENNYSVAYPILKKYKVPATIFLTTGFIDRVNFLWTDWLEFILLKSSDPGKKFFWQKKEIHLDLSNIETRRQSVERLKVMLKKMSINAVFNFLLQLQDFLQIEYNWDTIPNSLIPLDWDQIREMRNSGLVSFGAHTVSHPILSRCNQATQQKELFESKSRIEAELGEPCFLFAYPNGKKSDYSTDTIEILKHNRYASAVTVELGYNTLANLDPFQLKRWGPDVSEESLAFLVSGASQFSMRN